MPTRGTILKKLAGTAPEPKIITEDQGVKDIIEQMMIKTQACEKDYDRIYKDFEGGSIWDVSERLFNFCLDNITTFTEDEEKQFVSCPYTIMARGTSDCKGYALFIGGVLDAMRRHGADLDWNYRFASYNLFDMEPHHVFVVVNKKTDDIWIDPVIGEFNYHYGYWYKRDYPKRNRVGLLGFVGDTGDVVQPVPLGYPTNIAYPVLNGGKLLLRYNGTKRFPTTQEENLMLDALQPLVIKYATRPYNTHWSLSGWGSGRAYVISAMSPAGLLSQINRNWDWLQYPTMPSGLDKIEMGINDVLPTLLGAAASVIVPDSGKLVSNLVSSDTSGSGVNVSANLPGGSAAQQAALQQQAQGAGSGILTWINNNKLLSAAILAAVLLIIAESEK